ncbi:Bir1 [Kluyveromyces lactis]|nr:Bir1 [Kluyveromyces lactis]
MNDSNLSSAMDLSFLSDESSFQQIGSLNTPKLPKAEKRKRGRPRTKPVVPVELDANGNPIKKQRGRPRKNPTTETHKSAKKEPILDENGLPVKKRRGRPRKSLIDPTNISFTSESKKNTTTDNNINIQDTLGGIPKTLKAKHSHNVLPIAIQPKKRGRPKKTESIEGVRTEQSHEAMNYSNDMKFKIEKILHKEDNYPNLISSRDTFDPKKSSHRSDVSKPESSLVKDNSQRKSIDCVSSSIAGESDSISAYSSKGSTSLSSDDSYIPEVDPLQKVQSDHRADKGQIEFGDNRASEQLQRDTDSAIQTQAPRKRGRPKKLRDETAEPKVKRPRGRPPKDKVNKDKNQSASNTEKLPENQWTLNDIISGRMQQKDQLEASPKKKIKLAKTAAQLGINDSKGSQVGETSFMQSVEKNKDVFLDFKKNKEKATKPNTILDDSYDVFSFDNNGTSNFVIPEEAFPAQGSKKNKTEKSSPMKPLKEQLELIDTDIAFSDESENDSDYSPNENQDRVNSSPVQSLPDRERDFLRPKQNPIDEPGLATDVSKAQNRMEQGTDISNELVESQANKLGADNRERRTSNRLSDEWSLSLTFQDVNGQGTPDASPSNKPKVSFGPLPSSPDVNTKAVINNSNHSTDHPHLDQKYLDAESITQTTPIESLPKWNVLDNSELSSLSEDVLTLNKYFSDLLLYMNKVDASLASDLTGELTFFINSMPNEELALNFKNWIDQKGKEIFESFETTINTKIETLQRQFSTAKEFIQQIDDDSVLLEFANRFNIDF